MFVLETVQGVEVYYLELHDRAFQGCYNCMIPEAILLPSRIREFPELHTSTLEHELEHARIARSGDSWVRRLWRDVALDYRDRYRWISNEVLAKQSKRLSKRGDAEKPPTQRVRGEFWGHFLYNLLTVPTFAICILAHYFQRFIKIMATTRRRVRL